MKLFLATNSETSKTINIKLLEVACKYALKNTNFHIYVIFDGKKEELNLPKEINIIEHKHRCYDIFKNSQRCIKENNLFIASGAFLRTEIPFLCKKYNFKDEYILYCDYDTLFFNIDYDYLNNLKPEFFASCPEYDKNNWNIINTGVMLMNVNHFYNIDDFILNYINTNFESLTVWDQTLYNNLYKNKITKLSIEYNWKPYWGINNNAKIIHFHGAKPLSIEDIKRAEEPIIKHLRNLDKKSLEYYSDIWQQY